MNQSKRKNIVSAIITILILAGAGAIAAKMASQKKSMVSDKVTKKERRKVQVSTFDAARADNMIEIDGRLEAHDRVSINSKVQGLMVATTTTLRAGTYRKKGDLLVQLDDREMSYTLKAQKSALFTALTQLMPDIRFDYPDAFDKWSDYLQAYNIDAPIMALPEPGSDQERYFVAGRNIYNQYYSIKSLETKLADYKIYAPFSGVVTGVNVFPGALVSPSQPIATMINTATYEVIAPVPLDNVRYISTGQEVIMTSTELQKSWKGRVSRIGSVIDPATQRLPLYISLSGRGLKDGIYLRGELQGKPLDDVVQLPKDIFVTPTSVYLVRDSTIVAHEVEAVKRGADYVLVKGLSPEDKVITGSLAGLFEGQKVNY